MCLEDKIKNADSQEKRTEKRNPEGHRAKMTIGGRSYALNIWHRRSYNCVPKGQDELDYPLWWVDDI